ncbi:hypothetical protein B0J17DRAFT_683704 [Rhizoctonia solani]|nr:hypothetical protein B0J17DRAFT_683704 [Rhizoctonia solani]
MQILPRLRTGLRNLASGHFTTHPCLQLDPHHPTPINPAGTPRNQPSWHPKSLIP